MAGRGKPCNAFAMRLPLSFLASLLLLTASCGDQGATSVIRTHEVFTTLTVPEGGIQSTDRSVAARDTCKRELVLDDQPVFLRRTYSNGVGNWQQGEDWFLRTGPRSGSSSSQYGFIFLHGAAQIVGDGAAYAQIAFVTRLLNELGGGFAVFPQALPLFDLRIFCPGSDEDAPEYGPPTPNAFRAQFMSAWLPPLPPNAPGSCYADPEGEQMKAWVPFFDEYVDRIERIVLDLHHRNRIPLEKIYLLGFSEGSVMAQRALISLASGDLRIGGGVGYDGIDVEVMASQETLAELGSPPLEILYFMYSEEPAILAPHADCLRQFPSLDVQLNRITGDEPARVHDVHLPLIQPTKLWIEASNKQSAAPAVEAAWLEALTEIQVKSE